MKLQIALDDISIEDGIALINKIESFVDIIEIGTPLLYQAGMSAVESFKKQFPQKKILADMKIMDAGELETKMAFEAGADFVTVLGVTDNLTIASCLETAGQYQKEIVVDMICISDLEKRVAELERLGITNIAVHTGVDQQQSGRTAVDDLRAIKSSSKKSRIFAAGGISQYTAAEFVDLGADIIIAGGAVLHAQDPVYEVTQIRKGW